MELILYLAFAFYSQLVPFTKVEESFNMQAIYDLIYTPNLSDFDHFQFPGVVPRTFLGPIFISSILSPIKEYISKYQMLLATRLLMALLMASAFNYMALAIKQKYGNEVKVWFIRFTICQFHLMFWGSRTIPNTFALLLFVYSLAFLLLQDYNMMIITVVVATTCFRCELVPVGIFLCLLPVLTRQRRLAYVVFIAALCAFVSIRISIIVDSHYWNRHVWPEWEVFRFNGLKDGSSAWGVSPWHYYFTTLVPKIAPLSFPISILGVMYYFRHVSAFIIMTMIHLLVLSQIGHKEWRFVIYIVPMLNLSAALVCRKVLELKNIVKQIFQVALLAGFLGMLLMSALMIQASQANYPGGQALVAFSELNITANCKVHYDAYTASTGASKFLETNPRCVYSKFEDHKSALNYIDSYSHLITSDVEYHKYGWKIIKSIDGYVGYDIVNPKEIIQAVLKGFAPPVPIKIKLQPLVYILENQASK